LLPKLSSVNTAESIPVSAALADDQDFSAGFSFRVGSGGCKPFFGLSQLPSYFF
jgi:hypothetical protein